MDTSVNMNEVKYKRDEEPLIMDNSTIEVIKAPGYFKLFDWGKKISNNLDMAYKRACMKNAKEKYWVGIHDTIINYNDLNHTPFSNTNIREVIDQVILEEHVGANNGAVDVVGPQRNKSENLIKEINNLTINDVRKNLINKVANLTINDVGNN